MAGRFTVFDFWIPTARNPADRPSRLHSSRAAPPLPQPLPQSTVVLSQPSGWASREHLVLLVCGGPRRADDIGDFLERQVLAGGRPCKAISVDPCAEPDFDLTNANFFWELAQLCADGDVAAAMCSPPCSTISAARHRPLQGRAGPRPLRARHNPFAPLPGLNCLVIMLILGLKRKWVGLEHPADKGVEPFASFFYSKEVDYVMSKIRAYITLPHQCRFGGGVQDHHGSQQRRCRKVHGFEM